MRTILGPSLEAAGRVLAAAGMPAGALTAAGWVVGAGACAATALRAWPAALGLWLASRLLDGLDGPVARASGPTDAGGFADIVADFSVYAGVILGLAIALPQTRLACVALLTAYYVSGTAFLALSSLAERRRQPLGDNRSLHFVGGLAEGTETIGAYILLFLLPQHATVIVWVFTAAVAITAAQRVVVGLRLLLAPAPGGPPTGAPAGAVDAAAMAVPRNGGRGFATPRSS